MNPSGIERLAIPHQSSTFEIKETALTQECRMKQVIVETLLTIKDEFLQIAFSLADSQEEKAVLTGEGNIWQRINVRTDVIQ